MRSAPSDSVIAPPQDRVAPADAAAGKFVSAHTLTLPARVVADP
jgi:hypothetical protein